MGILDYTGSWSRREAELTRGEADGRLTGGREVGLTRGGGEFGADGKFGSKNEAIFRLKTRFLLKNAPKTSLSGVTIKETRDFLIETASVLLYPQTRQYPFRQNTSGHFRQGYFRQGYY